MNPFSLYLVTNSDWVASKGMTETIQRAIQGGVTAIQLREKTMGTREFVELGREVKKTLATTSIPLLVNDRIDIAQAIKAHGVHLGKTDMEFFDAKRILGETALIGLTIEQLSEIDKIRQYAPHYLGVGAIFPSTTKRDAPSHWSKHSVRRLKRLTPCPLIGIGGINAGNAGEVLRWGLDGIAVSQAICGGDCLRDVEDRSIELKEIIQNHRNL